MASRLCPPADLRIRISHNRQRPRLCISVSRGILHAPRRTSMYDDAANGRKRARLLGGRSLGSDINNPRRGAFQCAASSAASIPRPSALSRSPKGRKRRTKPSTQTGTPRWTHHHVTSSKQRTGVETARNFIPAPSTIVSPGSLLSLGLVGGSCNGAKCQLTPGAVSASNR
jgi:hypothetical protein